MAESGNPGSGAVLSTGLEDEDPSESLGDRKRRILVFDTEGGARTSRRDAIERAGFSVLEVESEAEVMEAFTKRRPDAVIVDLTVGDQGGDPICSRLRKAPGGGSIPILALTGPDGLETIEDARTFGVTDFSTRPVNWDL